MTQNTNSIKLNVHG